MENTYDRLQPLSKEQIQLIHSKSIEILEKTGFWFDSQKARDIFKSNGFRVEGELVYITGKDVEKALETVPEQFIVRGRDPEKDLIVGGDHFTFSNNAGAPFIADADGTVRVSSSEDFKNFLKVNHQLDAIGFGRDMVGSSKDIPSEHTLMYEFLWHLKLTDKPAYCVFGDGAPLLSMVFGIDRKKMQDDSLKRISYAIGNYNPRTPLALENSQCHRCIDLAEWGIAACISPMPMAGMTGPVTLPGLIVLQNTEVLAPMVLSQLVSPGTPVIYGILATTTDMKTMVAPTAAPEVGIIMRACTQMAKYYGLPTRGDVGLSDACCLDFQAGAESAYHLVNAIRCGVNLMPGLGSLQSRGIGSLEKLVLDAEIADQAVRMIKPLEFNEERLAMDAISEVGQKGNFLTNPHTFKHFRTEIYNPKVFTRTSYTIWQQDGSKDAVTHAHERVKELLDSYVQPKLGASLERDMDAYARKQYAIKRQIRNRCH